MSQHDEIKTAYRMLGNEATFYDGMITCSTLLGKVVCGLVWNMDKEKNDRYLERALSGIPEHFSGRLLEVPVGTGVLTMPVYRTLPDAGLLPGHDGAGKAPCAEERDFRAGGCGETFLCRW